jgi:hypothetical protein
VSQQPPTQPPAPPPTQPPAPPPAQPPGQPPAYPAQPANGAPPPGPSRRGVSGTVAAVIVIVVVAVVAGAVVFVFVGRDEPEPPPPLPTSETPMSPSPIPVGTPIETPEAPPATLIDFLPPTVGQFSLQNAAPDPQSVASFGATDAIVANYVRGDGTLIIHNLLAYPTRIEADIAKAQLVDNLVFDLGYRRAGSIRRDSINATRLVGADEVVVWSHSELLAALEGPFDLTTGFFLILPY